MTVCNYFTLSEVTLGDIFGMPCAASCYQVISSEFQGEMGLCTSELSCVFAVCVLV
jgi:hypothetical protein